jgi:hypothetical protein
MKRLYFVWLLVLVAMPAILSAHGGVSNQSGNIVIFLTQQPLSPLINEEVKMTFSVKNKDFTAIAGAQVGVRLIETNNDPSLDNVIVTENITTDVNGNFDFTYKFDKEGYYDVELSVPDPSTGELAVIGFLVQPRQVQLPWMRIIIATLIIFAVTSTYTFIKLKKPVQ